MFIADSLHGVVVSVKLMNQENKQTVASGMTADKQNHSSRDYTFIEAPYHVIKPSRDLFDLIQMLKTFKC